MHGQELMTAMKMEAQAFIRQALGNDVTGSDHLTLQLAEKLAASYVRGGVAALAEHTADLKALQKVPT